MKSITLHKLAFDNAAQVIIISQADDGKIISCNKATAKLLGYSSKELLTKTWLSVFEKRDKGVKEMKAQLKAHMHAEVLVCVVKKTGLSFSSDVTSVAFKDASGTPLLVTTIADRRKGIRHQKTIDTRNRKAVAHDIVIAKSKQKKIDTIKSKRVASDIVLAQARSNRQLKLIVNSSSDIFYDIDLVSNVIVLSDAYEKQFGYKVKKNMLAVDAWASHIHPDDREKVIADYTEMLATSRTEWRYKFRFLKADHAVATVLSSAIVMRDRSGVAYRMLGSMQDVSRQAVLEQKLVNQISQNEIEVADAMEIAQDAERSDLGQELHDNVSQLLAASRMYLQMAKGGAKNSEQYLSQSSEYSLEALNAIRKLSHRLVGHSILSLGLHHAIESISQDIMETTSLQISWVIDLSGEAEMTEKFKINVFRIVQEQLNNILKHANASTVTISLRQNKTTIKLIIKDDGIGFDTARKVKGIGLANIKSRAIALKGAAQFTSQPGKGCLLTVVLPAVAFAK